MASYRLWNFVGMLLAVALVTVPANRLRAQEIPGPRISPAVKTPRILHTTDVALSRDNVLLGQVYDNNGPLPDAEVLVSQGSREIVRVVADGRGVFQVALPHAGLYLVSSGTSVAVVRAWVRGTAPPNAARNVIVEPRTIRLQSPMLGIQSPLWNPQSHMGFGSTGSATAAALVGVGALAASAVIFGPDIIDGLNGKSTAPATAQAPAPNLVPIPSPIPTPAPIPIPAPIPVSP